MVWLMDTVDGSGRDAMRYLSWADIYIVVSRLYLPCFMSPFAFHFICKAFRDKSLRDRNL